ncbi:MAG: carboxymuconolactone decarboxylase family protein [Candidatus Rokubacteria bacterium]|nr:carboxymuconolactone decarboxylase family protein [Candidatus Rokubacteria bacterium]
MARIPSITRKDELAPEHHAVWEAIAQSRGHVIGPFTALLHRPELARRVSELGAWVRFESALAPADRELLILTVARTFDCRFEWAAHVPLARQAGVREEAIAALRDRRAPAGLTAPEAALVGYVGQLLAKHRVDDATFAALRARLGDRGLVEVTASAGYYALIACTLNAFAIEPEPGAERLPV